MDCHHPVLSVVGLDARGEDVSRVMGMKLDGVAAADDDEDEWPCLPW